MAFASVTPGSDAPAAINVAIEIPMRSDPVKYEVDKDTGTLFVDRLMGTAMHYPCNYGFVPQTLAEDGDPVDVLVITPFPLIHGCVIKVRPLGMLSMSDEAGTDHKVLAVPTDKIAGGVYEKVRSLDDLPAITLSQITHFFDHYKDLEKNKWVKIEGWADREAAEREITAGMERYAREG
jgi:inorganic pyrophosphatase